MRCSSDQCLGRGRHMIELSLGLRRLAHDRSDVGEAQLRRRVIGGSTPRCDECSVKPLASGAVTQSDRRRLHVPRIDVYRTQELLDASPRKPGLQDDRGECEGRRLQQQFCGGDEPSPGNSVLTKQLVERIYSRPARQTPSAGAAQDAGSYQVHDPGLVVAEQVDQHRTIVGAKLGRQRLVVTSRHTARVDREAGHPDRSKVWVIHLGDHAPLDVPRSRGGRRPDR